MQKGLTLDMFIWCVAMILGCVSLSCAQADETIACPQPPFRYSAPSISTDCEQCDYLVEAYSNQMRHTDALLEQLNAATTEFNAECETIDYIPGVTVIPTTDENGDPIHYCGPDATGIFQEALVRIMERMKNVPDTDKGLIDAANPLSGFLIDNGINIDQKPRLALWPGKANCPSGPCAAAGNPKGQDCFNIWGYCVPQHVMNDIAFGFVGDQVWVPEAVQVLGGHFHEYKSRDNLDPSSSTASYKAGDEISEAMEEDGTIDQDDIKTEMDKLMKFVKSDYGFIEQCKPCPDSRPIIEWKADFSTRPWTLSGGKKDNYGTGSSPIADKMAADRMLENNRTEHIRSRLSVRAERMRTLKAQLDRAIDQLDTIRNQLTECEQQHCGQKEPSELGKLFGDILGGVDMDEVRRSEEEIAARIATACAKCEPLANQFNQAQSDLAALEKQLGMKQIKQQQIENDLQHAQNNLDAISNDLSNEEGIGAESIDPTTGIRITSYDNGQGQVEIKRFDKEGNQMGETEYRKRPSTANKRDRLEKLEKEVASLKQKRAEAEKEASRLKSQIKAMNKRIADLKKALNDCLEKCITGRVDIPEQPKPSSNLLDDDDFEVELEDARSTDGVNAFDAKEVGDIHVMPSGGSIDGTGIDSRDDGPAFIPAGNSDTSSKPNITYTPPGREEPIEIEVETPVPANPAPPPPLQVSSSGTINFAHTVGGSPCPQPAGQVTFSANSGNQLSIVNSTVSGTIAPKLTLTPQGNVLMAQFNCSSPQHGSFDGTITATVKDVSTGQTQSVRVPAQGTVGGG